MEAFDAMTLENVTLVQSEPTVGPASDGTLDRLCKAVRAAGTDLVVFPELATTGYRMFPRVDECAEPIPGPTTRRLGEAAAAAGSHVVFGMATVDDGRTHNSAVWIDRDGDVRARYDKRQLWGDEQEVFTPGEELLLVEVEGHSVGVQICYDLDFPEQSAAFAAAGIDVLINVSAWSVPMGGDWDRLLPARALENGAFVLACNRAGREADLNFYGHSRVYNPDGSVGAELSAEPGRLTHRLEYDRLERERTRNPMRADRRGDSPPIDRVRISV